MNINEILAFCKTFMFWFYLSSLLTIMFAHKYALKNNIITMKLCVAE